MAAFCLLLSAYCLLPTAFCSSIFILVLIVVEIFLFDDVEFDRIEADNFQMHSAFFTFDCLAFIRFHINVDIGFTFGTRSGRHFSYLHGLLFDQSNGAGEFLQ